MNRKGFTLIELLVVISIVAIATGSAIMAFDKSNSDTNKTDRTNKYLQIQRSALLFLDTNDSWRSQFNEKSYIKLKLAELQTENYVDEDLYDAVNFEEFDREYVVLIYMYKYNNTEVVDTCLIRPEGNEYRCIANSVGDSYDCCMHQDIFNVSL